MPEDSGSKYKSPVLDLKGGLWLFRKDQRSSTASDQYFLSYVKKTKLPPPVEIGLNKMALYY